MAMYQQKIPHGIMFHHFHNNTHLKTQGSISGADFKDILNYVGRERILSPLEWLERLVENRLKAEDLCLTFDDGLLSQIKIALPILEHFKLKAFWFVYSGIFEGKLENLEIYRSFRTKYFDTLDSFYLVFFQKVSESGLAENADLSVEENTIKDLQKTFPFYSRNDAHFRFLRDKVIGWRNYEKIMDSILADYRVHKEDLSKRLWMSNQDLKQLNDNGHVIGLHSYSHPTSLAGFSFKEQSDEYQKNYSHLKQICGKNPVSMSHPCSSYNADTLQILRELKISCGFLSNMLSQPIAKNQLAFSSNLEIPREDHANIMRLYISPQKAV